MNEHLTELFITCSQGLEQLLADELKELGYPDSYTSYRGVYVKVPDLKAVYRINYCSRIGGRVLLPLIRFKCFDKMSLYRNASKVEWLQYILKGKTFAIDSNVNHKNLTNSLFATQVVKDAICDQFRDKTGTRPDVDVQEPDVQLNLFIHEERAIISFDTSGSPLYKRGYRLENVAAPLQESMAAALLRLAKYKEGDILYDPCCGSGTFLIEAALIASETPPGYLRKKWGFMSLPDFSQEDWLKVKAEADKNRKPLQSNQIYGSELSTNSVRITKVNLRAAGFSQQVQVAQSDFREYTPSFKPNLIITNPPHGIRLESIDDLKKLYRSLGEFIKKTIEKPGKAFIFTGSLELTKEVGLTAKRRHVINNSGIDSRLLEYDLY